MISANTQSIGSPHFVTGKVIARSPDGVERIIKVGDKIFASDTIITAASSSIHIDFNNGETVEVFSNQNFSLADYLQQNGFEFAGEIEAEQVEEVLAANETTPEPLPDADGELTIEDILNLPAPTAGQQSAGGGIEEPVIIPFDIRQVTPDTRAVDTGIGGQTDEITDQIGDDTGSVINNAPAITVTANNFTEDSGAAAGDVAATYVATDPDGDALTVSFTPGTNTNGHYVLNNGRVELTQAGVDAINAGQPLDPVDLTVTDDGNPSQSASDSDTPVVTTVNDAPTIDVTANNFTEDSGAQAGDVAGTYVTRDEEGDNLTVSFTPGTNTNGHYVLANGRVELTQAGVDAINAGQQLDTIDLTVSDDNLTGQDRDDPVVTTVNDAPTIDVTANDFTENSAAANDVAATYATGDEDGDNLTVNWNGPVPSDPDGDPLYLLDTANNRVLLTQAGADHVNAGNDLPPVNLTVTDDGAGNLTGQDSDDPNVTTVNDAPEIDVTANDFTENSAAANQVAATYTTADEDGDNLTVSWTGGNVPSDPDGDPLYQLDTANNRVLLTQAGADYVNAGNDLPPVNLTVTDDGAGNLTGQDSDDPNVTTVNDAPEIDVTANDFTENSAAANQVAATYTTADEDG
ncbi:hypothetical protein, partial [Spongorhabdus nitratireducens]